jgi:tetratricopeptide (TPR) repeat protein
MDLPIAALERLAVESLYATGHWLLSQERVLDAARVLRVLLLSQPSDERAWLALGVCHERLGRLDEAMALYTAGAVACAPSARCWLARARLFADQGMDNDAATARLHALRCAIDDKDPELRALAEASDLEEAS